MGFQTQIAEALIAQGLKVEYVPGWETRGSASFNPGGVVDHWTAGPRNATGRPSLNVVTNGRTGLPGPLCNVYGARDGVAVIVAAGRANHAGLGGIRGLKGNSAVYGIEAESAGDAGGSDWTDAQRESYPKINAGLLNSIGRDASWAFGHNEWAPTRKIDIRDWDMKAMREQTASVMAGGLIVPTQHIIVPATGRPVLGLGSKNSYVGIVQRFLGINDDNSFGPDTKKHVKDYQSDVGLVPDGWVGDATWSKVDAGVRPAPAPASNVVAPGVPAPAFPLHSYQWFGWKSGGENSISGYFSHREDLRRWQRQMRHRGWRIDDDGLYGPGCNDVCVKFQNDKGLDPDGRVGAITWAAAWTAPITR